MAIAGDFPEGDLVMQQGRDAILLEAASKAADWLKLRYGGVDPPEYAYGDMKVTSFDDAYGTGMEVFSRPTDGGEDTICVATNTFFSEFTNEWATSYVSVERSVGTFAPDGTPEVHVNFPVGNHADPDSPDTAAANSDYVEGRYRKLLFRRGEIEAALRERIELWRIE